MKLEAEAERWIEPYWNAEHLRRARDWALELDPQASQAIRLAALTHDVERMFPGGPPVDPTLRPDDEEYNRIHAERSARFVARWLREQGADEALVAETAELVRLHEVGGTAAADLVQAADSLSFLEVNGDVAIRWLREGRATLAQSRAKLDYMFERIRVPRARELALRDYERSVAELELAA